MGEAPRTPSNSPLGLLRLPAADTCVYSCPRQGQLDLWQCPGVTRRRIQLLAHTASRGHHQARLLFLKVGPELSQLAESLVRPTSSWARSPPGGGLATPASLPQLPVSFKVPRPTGLPSHCPWSLSPSSFSPAALPWRLSCLFRAAGPWQHGEGQPPHTPHFSLSKGGLSGFLLAVSRTQPTFPRGRACSVMCLSDHGQDFKGPHEILTPSLGDSPGYRVHLWVLAAVPPTELSCHVR